MITSFSARNFRCFRDFTIEPLERFNLIAGRNNSGKTCLLEGLFLLAWGGRPDPVLSVDRFRRMPDAAGDPDAAWGWLFYRKNRVEAARLSTRWAAGEANGMTSTLTVEEVPAEKYAMVGSRSGAASASSLRELKVTFQERDSKARGARVVMSAQGIPQAELVGQPTATRAAFVTTSVPMGPDGVRTFSLLQQVHGERPIVDALRLLEPRVTALSVLAPTGEPVLCADVGLDRLVPLPLLGDGPARMVQTMLAVEQAREGTLLVDEIDNGVHYSALKDVWTALRHAAREADVQIFATTHSWECIRAAHEAFSEADEYDFRLHRLDRAEDGEISATTYDRELLGSAVEFGVEVR